MLPCVVICVACLASNVLYCVRWFGVSGGTGGAAQHRLQISSSSTAALAASPACRRVRFARRMSAQVGVGTGVFAAQE